MKKILMSLLIITALAVGSSAQDVSDEALLEAMDATRFLESTTLSFTSEVVADRPDGSSQALVQLFFKENEAGEQFSRIEFLQPEDMAGEVFISGPDGTFLWNPDLFSPLKVSDQQGVFGDASVAETVGIRFNNGDYAVAVRESITLEGGIEGLDVMLEATTPDVAFQSIMVTVDLATLQPVKMRLFALGGEPINDVTFLEYAELDGDTYAVQQLIESQFVEGNKTLLTITNISTDDLDDALFDPDQLGQS